jgi:hypothetical protein
MALAKTSVRQAAFAAGARGPETGDPFPSCTAVSSGSNRTLGRLPCLLASWPYWCVREGPPMYTLRVGSAWPDGHTRLGQAQRLPS